jgi:hypothetical protein
MPKIMLHNIYFWVFSCIYHKIPIYLHREIDIRALGIELLTIKR